MKKVEFLVLLLFLTLLSVVPVACGGGGGGGGGSAGLSYSGSTAKVTIDESNAEEIAISSYTSIDSAGGIAPLGIATVEYKDGVTEIKRRKNLGRPLPLAVSQVLKDSLLKLNIDVEGNISIASTESDTVYGNCGGSASYTINVNDSTYDFSGTFNYMDFCVDGTSVSGNVNISGNISSYPATFNFVFNNLSMTDGINSYISTGHIYFVMNNDTNAVISIDMLINDINSAKVYWVNDFNVTLTAAPDYADTWITGRYYDPDYGYAVLSTPLAIRMYNVDSWPSSGELLVEGNTGIAGGSTKAKLKCLTNTTYEVRADTNGDGTYDWWSGVKNWADL